MPSPPSTRPSGARGRRSFVFVREDGEAATEQPSPQRRIASPVVVLEDSTNGRMLSHTPSMNFLLAYSSAAFPSISCHDEKDVCSRTTFSHAASEIASQSACDSTLNPPASISASKEATLVYRCIKSGANRSDVLMLCCPSRRRTLSCIRLMLRIASSNPRISNICASSVLRVSRWVRIVTWRDRILADDPVVPTHRG